jgi:hypothetical protein
VYLGHLHREYHSAAINTSLPFALLIINATNPESHYGVGGVEKEHGGWRGVSEQVKRQWTAHFAQANESHNRAFCG